MQPRWVQTPTTTSHCSRAPPPKRCSSVCGSGRSSGLTALASAISLVVRRRMKTGEPRHLTVIAWPSSIGLRSTSVVEAASVSFAGFRLSSMGHTEAPVANAPSAPPARNRKSRRPPPSPCAPAAPAPSVLAEFAIWPYLIQRAKKQIKSDGYAAIPSRFTAYSRVWPGLSQAKCDTATQRHTDSRFSADSRGKIRRLGVFALLCKIGS